MLETSSKQYQYLGTVTYGLSIQKIKISWPFPKEISLQTDLELSEHEAIFRGIARVPPRRPFYVLL